MKKFLSKVLTLALVCAIVVTGTAITSEAKGTKSSKKAATTTYSSNAVVNDFVATMLKSNGLVIDGKSYNSQELITLGFAANPAVTVSPMYGQTDGTYTHDNGHVETIGTGRCCGFYLYADGSTGLSYTGASTTIYLSDISEFELNEMKSFGYTDYNDNAVLNSDGVWNTDAFIANGINTQYICSWMQSRGLNTSTDIYNYLVANGATFTVDTGLISSTRQSFVCVQCPNLFYEISNDGSDTRIYYNNENLSGVNIADINSYFTSTQCTHTQWFSGIQH